MTRRPAPDVPLRAERRALLLARRSALAVLVAACHHGQAPEAARTAGSERDPAVVAAPANSSDAAASEVADGGALEGESASSSCGDPGDVTVFVSPEHPVRGRPLRVVAVSERPIDASLALARVRKGRSADAGLEPAIETAERHGGPPYAWIAQLDAAEAGTWRATLVRGRSCGAPDALVTRDVTVGVPWPVAAPPRTALWPTRRAWSPANENLYSAWIEHLFDALPDVQPSWSALHDVLRDPTRNFLFDHLGAAEDEQGVVVRPDCADLPYFLRAYFAYKLGLPFGWSRCSRGEGGQPPRCAGFATNEDPFPADPDGGAPPPLPAWASPDRDADGGPWESSVKRMGELFRTTLADAVQSGAGRTAAEDDESDYYPVRLSIDTLRPGTIFADPYGHVLVVAKRLPQTVHASGVLFAVDGQPDGTVARKRFWRGNFLFAIDPQLGSAGFKRFRPVLRDPSGRSRRLVRAKNADLPDASTTDQYEAGVEGFYDRVEDVLSPAPVPPEQAMLEALQALEEQVRTRVLSVDNGRKFLAGGGPPAPMPDGEKIFETTGPWEDFSTPSRDLRLLIAIDVVLGLPARVARRPARYVWPAGKTVDTVRRDLEERLSRELQARRFSYTRTDGSPWELSLRDVVDRQVALEVAYDPNDCVETRWGAPPGSPEAAPCVAHAPAPQVEKMAAVRAWFHERRRPPR